MQVEGVDDEGGNRVDVVEIKHRQVGLDRLVAGHRDNIRVIRPQRRLAVGRAVDFQLGHRLILETFDQHQIAGREAGQVFVERGFRLITQFMQQRPALRAGEHHLAGPGFAVTVGVLARPVDVEAVVRVLDDRNLQAARGQPWNQLFDQRRLARPGKTGDTENLHCEYLCSKCIHGRHFTRWHPVETPTGAGAGPQADESARLALRRERDNRGAHIHAGHREESPASADALPAAPAR